MSRQQGFAIWLTGLPASGKSSITRELVTLLRARGVAAVVLESDAMRKILTPDPTYSEEERDLFYSNLALVGELITRSGANVIFDATANKREYRDRARRLIAKFIEVYVACPLEVCTKRDPKGIYARAALGKTTTVPGLQAAYEPPLQPDLTLDGQAPAGTGAVLVLDKLKQLLYI
jgi:adenylylsulfate kinase